MFEKMCAAVKDEAKLIAISYVDRADVTYASDEEMEKAHRQFVSGWMFNEFGLKPVSGGCCGRMTIWNRESIQ
jgi:hypothetical protein